MCRFWGSVNRRMSFSPEKIINGDIEIVRELFKCFAIGFKLSLFPITVRAYRYVKEACDVFLVNAFLSS